VSTQLSSGVKLPERSSPLAERAGLALVVVLFCAPLFVGLERWDLRSDEAIYSYSVDRILETGEWLTPRSIEVDGPFLEKPPLKFWMVAGLSENRRGPAERGRHALARRALRRDRVRLRLPLRRATRGALCGLAAAVRSLHLRRAHLRARFAQQRMESAAPPLLLRRHVSFARWVDGDGRPSRHAAATCPISRSGS
jgi:hypothetical protein